MLPTAPNASVNSAALPTSGQCDGEGTKYLPLLAAGEALIVSSLGKVSKRFNRVPMQLRRFQFARGATTAAGPTQAVQKCIRQRDGVDVLGQFRIDHKTTGI
jgi:hypothetical protein